MKLRNLLASKEWDCYFKELGLPVHSRILVDSLFYSVFDDTDELQEWCSEAPETTKEPDCEYHDDNVISIPVPNDGGHMIISVYTQRNFKCVGFTYESPHQSSPLTYWYSKNEI